MSLAIIIPVYNREHLLPRTLASIAAQTLRPLHVVLVDNASTDGSLALMHRWADDHSAEGFRVSVMECSVPGAAAARQSGLDAIDDDAVLFFDSDDTMSSTHAERAARALSAGADLVGWDVTEVRPDGRRKTLTFLRNNPQTDSLFHGAMATQRWAASTALVRRAGGWNPTVRLWDDIELGARMLSLNPRVSHLGLSGVEVHVTADSISSGTSPAAMLHTLGCISSTLANVCGADRARYLTDLKYVIESAARRGLPSAELHAVASDHPLRRRLALHFAYRYTRLGLPGAARLLLS